MKPLKPEDKQFILYAVLITILAVGAAGYFSYTTLMNYTESMGELADLRVKLEDAREKQARVSDLEEAIEKAEMEIAEVERKLPNDKRAPELFKELNDLAVIANQDYLSMQAREVLEKDIYFEIPLQINLKADYHNLGRYLNMIERSRRHAKIDNIVIDYDFDNPLEQQVKLTVSTFMFKKTPETQRSGDRRPATGRS